MLLRNCFVQIIVVAIALLAVGSGCASLPRMTSSLSFNVAGFGAKGDGKTLDTTAFQHAIEAAKQSGGATVLVPRGTYLIAPINLCSGLKLLLAEGAVVKLADDPALYPLIDTRFNGLMQPARRAAISADGCSDFSIIGAGVIDGSGPYWWSQVREETPAAVSTQPTGDAHSRRPPMLQLRNCRNVRIEGVTFRNPPRSAVHVLFSENVFLRLAQFDAPPASDTIGVEIDSSKSVRLDDCRAAVGARAVSIEAGRQDASPRAARPTEDVAIRSCTFSQSATAIAIGPNIHGGVLGVRVSESRFDGGDFGVQIHSTPDRTGTIQDVWLTDLDMKNIGCPLTLSLRGKTLADQLTAGRSPTIRDVEVARLTVRGAQRAGIIEGQEQSPIRNLRFENLNLSARYGISCSHAADVSFNMVQIATDFGPAILRTDTSNLQIDNWNEATRPADAPTSQPATAKAASRP